MQERRDIPVASKLKSLDKTEITEEELRQAILSLFRNADNEKFVIRACEIRNKLLKEFGIIANINTIAGIVNQLHKRNKLKVLDFDGHSSHHVCASLMEI